MANAILTGVETTFLENEIIVSKTDLTGKLVYGNRTFYKMAGMDEKECIGKQHNIIRNPDMPRSVFDLLWDNIKGGNEIFAYVNNRAKNGDNYWVLAHVTPSRDRNNQIVGYHSNRRSPNKSIITDKIIPLYKDLMSIEQSAASPKDGLNNARKKIDEILRDTKMEFNQLIFSMGV